MKPKSLIIFVIEIGKYNCKLRVFLRNLTKNEL